MTEHLTGMMSLDDFLEHYGVKGMKWGKRKAKGPASADAARVNKIKKRVKKSGLDNLSNDDLAKLNKRNQLISEYKKSNPNALKRGNQAAKEALAVVGTVSAVAVAGTKLATKTKLGAEAVSNIVQGARAVASLARDTGL